MPCHCGGSGASAAVNPSGRAGFLAALTGLVTVLWQTLTADNHDKHTASRREQLQVVLFPDATLEKELAGLYGSGAALTAQRPENRFRIGDAPADRALLMAAPRARISEQVTGILVSSNAQKLCQLSAQSVVSSATGSTTKYQENTALSAYLGIG